MQALLADTFPKVRNTQAEGEHPPSPREMLDLFELPPGFKVTLFAGEPDVQQPIAFDFDDYGRIWVAENYTYSARGKIDQVMRDRVIILHDKDGDGEHDERKIFWDKGRMLTGLTWGYGGLWILNDGTLSFIPDKNGDDIPDSEPVPLLNGWTKNAGHNVVNGLLWGPDGWLYGRHGITDTSYPGTIDTPKEERKPMNCGIWRFHPVKHTFEIVCHGTTNPWGLDYNEVGDMFMSNNVIGHLWHVIPGAHYQRMFGQDFNPHCYELMGPISDHYHWDDTGKWSDSRDGKANDLGGGHSHCGLMLYYGQNFPKEYWGKAFMCNTHGRCVNVDRIERKGSSYVAKHEPNFLKVNTPWFRGVQLTYGPAGCVYLSDWSDNGECHDHDGVHRTSGRIYRISYGVVKGSSNIAAELNEWGPELQFAKATFFEDTPEWARRHASRRSYELLTSEHVDSEPWVSTYKSSHWGRSTLEHNAKVGELRQFRILGNSGLFSNDDFIRAAVGANEIIASEAVKVASQYPEAWRTIRPVVESHLWHYDTSPRFDLHCLCGLIRNADHSTTETYFLLNMLRRLSKSSEQDDTLRLMHWYAVLALSEYTSAALSPTAGVLPFHIRCRFRPLAESWPKTKDLLIEEINSLLNLAEMSGSRAFLNFDADECLAASLEGLKAGFEARISPAVPEGWRNLKRRLFRRNSEAIDKIVAEWDLAFGHRKTIEELREKIVDKLAPYQSRQNGILGLSRIQDSESVPIFLSLLNDKAVYVDICKALAAFDEDPRIPKELLKRWKSLRHGAKEAATDTLCGRKSYAVEFTKAIADGRVDSGILTAAQVRQLNSFNDESITAIVDQHWGTINETPEALEASMAKWKQELTDEVLAKADLDNGAALFKKSCATCHKLYGEGGKIGPDLTGGNRANMDYLLSNIINPSGEVPKQYTTSILHLESGQVITGVVVSETD